MDPLSSPTEVYDSYWWFAAERQAIYERRLAGNSGPWTDHPILSAYRFTNTYRAADRVSQFLIADVQYREDRSQAPQEIFFRTLLFKIFNRIETWVYLERLFGPLSWQSADFHNICLALSTAMDRGERIYSAAYIMPAPNLGYIRKHENHLALLKSMMDDSLPGKIERARSLREVYELLIKYPGFGPFLAFQYSIDLNYSNLLAFDEIDFVVAGPGALDGIAKCFGFAATRVPESVIYAMVDRQASEFRRLNLKFNGLFGRALRPIDCQNLFCEISKFSRVAHPMIKGLSDRVRIKQSYSNSMTPLPMQVFPARWNLRPTMPVAPPPRSEEQLLLFD